MVVTVAEADDAKEMVKVRFRDTLPRLVGVRSNLFDLPELAGI